MSTIFLDMRSEIDFAKDPIKDAINIPLSDIVLDHKLGAIKLLPKDTIIEYYHPFPGNIEELFINILNQHGFMNLINRGNIIAPPIIYEYKPVTTIRFMEQKEKIITS